MVSQFIMKTCFEQKNIASLVLVPSTYWVIRLLEKQREKESVIHSCSTKKSWTERFFSGTSYTGDSFK